MANERRVESTQWNFEWGIKRFFSLLIGNVPFFNGEIGYVFGVSLLVL